MIYRGIFKILIFVAAQALSGPLLLLAQHPKDPIDFKIYKEWQPFDPLEWEDFKASERPAQYHGDAGSVVKIKAKPYFVRKKIYYQVHALFNKKKSWALERSPQLLRHEQLHFDIAELYARRIRKKIRDLSKSGKNDLKVYNNEIRELLKESNDYDRLYDIETLHGSLTEKQKEWEEKVQKALLKLKDFKAERRVVRN